MAMYYLLMSQLLPTHVEKTFGQWVLLFFFCKEAAKVVNVWPRGEDSWRPLTLLEWGLIECKIRTLPSKTAAYWNSVLQALSRLLADRNSQLSCYLHELSYVFFFHSSLCRRSRFIILLKKLKVVHSNSDKALNVLAYLGFDSNG